MKSLIILQIIYKDLKYEYNSSSYFLYKNFKNACFSFSFVDIKTNF